MLLMCLGSSCWEAQRQDVIPKTKPEFSSRQPSMAPAQAGGGRSSMRGTRLQNTSRVGISPITEGNALPDKLVQITE